MVTRYAGEVQLRSASAVVYTVDAGSTTTSATITAFTNLEAYDTIRIHNYGATDVYARVTLDGTNYTPGDIKPIFVKTGGSTNAILSTGEIGTLTGPFAGVGVMALEAGSTKVVIQLK